MRTVGCLLVVVMSLAAVDAPAKEWKAWIEAEDYAAQSGSQAAFYRMEETASEGRIVDNDWGRDAGDFLRWSIEIPQPCDPLYVTVKFARAFPNPASIRVRAGNGQALVQFPTTGGWGFENEQWHYGEIRLEGLSPGRYAVELTSTARDSNLNTDGLFVSNQPLAVEGKKIVLEDVNQRRSLAVAAETDPALRRRLLAPYRDRIQRIVFTKHFNMGGSHYAYTDAVSDEDTLNPCGTVKEFNFQGGSSLCLLEIGEDYDVSETVLLHDEDGVFRDPDVSYDGRRILFAWKKSARDDDYHLHEMDFETRAVRQLTFGLGFADYEGIYLPNGDIMFSSTRCVQNVDQWQYPYPLDESNYLVTFRPEGEARFGIYFMNKLGQRTLLAADPSISCNQPVPLAPRPRPPQPVYPTDWSRKTGAFVIQDVYHGQGLEGVARGTVEKIRVVALDYMATDIGRKHGPSAISDLAAWDVKVVLGEAPVHEDGSAAFEVPARTPVYFQAIDAAGHVIQTMRSWSTLMPDEVFGCIGCHESKNETVEAKPATLALQAGIQPLDPFYDVTGKGFSFPKTIQPIFDAKCVRCHDGSEPPDLRATPVWDAAARKYWNRSYHELISTDRPSGPANDTNQHLEVIEERSRYLSWIGRWSVPVMIPPYSHGSSRSPLISLLKAGHEGVQMTEEEMDKLSCWIDLALPHSGDWTEGMTSEDKERYQRVYQKRLDWQKQEAANIQAYLDAQKDATQSARH